MLPEASIGKPALINGLQMTVVEEAMQILRDHKPVDSGELVASPWLGLHYKHEPL